MINQYEEINLNVNTNIFKDRLSKIELPKEIPKNPKYQFKELTNKLFPIYGRRIFQIPYETFYTDYKLEKAHEITEKYCKGNIRYLLKVMRGMPY